MSERTLRERLREVEVLFRPTAIQWIDNNFGTLSGLPNATERLIACFIGGLRMSWDNATAELTQHADTQADRIAALEAALREIETLSPAVTHGWAQSARHIARTALEGADR